MKFTIDRATWLRGQKNSVLLNGEGKRCCLGFFAQACGYSDKQMRGMATPYGVQRYYRTENVDWQTMLNKEQGDSSVEAYKLMSINDDLSSTDEEKEKCITQIFSQLGIEVEFK